MGKFLDEANFQFKSHEVVRKAIKQSQSQGAVKIHRHFNIEKREAEVIHA